MSLYRIKGGELERVEKTAWPPSLTGWLHEQLLVRDDLLPERFFAVGTWDTESDASGVLALDERGDLAVVVLSDASPAPALIARATELAWDLRHARFSDLEALWRKRLAVVDRPNAAHADLAAAHGEFFALSKKRPPAQFNRTQRVILAAPAFAREAVDAVRLHRLETQIDAYTVSFVGLGAEDGLVSVEPVGGLGGGRIASLVSLVVNAPSAIADRLLPEPEEARAGEASASDGTGGIVHRIAALPKPVEYGVLGALMLLYTATFSILTVRLHNNFGTYGFDLGIFDQGVWLLSRLKNPFITVRGLPLFGDHLSFILVLIAPLYRIWDDARLLLVLQTIALGIGALPVFLIAKERLKNSVLSLAMAASYLLYPALQWLNGDHFHPESFATPSLLFAFYFAMKKRYVAFAVVAALAVLAKEDVALIVMLMGIYIAVANNRTVGIATSVAALAWFVVGMRFILPQFNETGFFYIQHYSRLGATLPEVVYNSITNPGLVASIVTEQKKLTYILQLLAPVAFSPLASIEVLLITAPALFSNLISQQGYMDTIQYHYTATIIPFIFISSIFAIEKLGLKSREAIVVAALVLAVAITSNHFWSPSPLAEKYRQGYWILASDKRDVMEKAVSLIPEDAHVSAVYNIVPHLTHREYIYEFPNPFRAVNWGIRGENPADPDSIEYIVINTSYLSDEDRTLVRRLRATEFREIFNESDIVVLKRKA